MSEPSDKSHDERHRGPSRTSPYPMSRLAPTHDLVNVAQEIQAADAMIASVTGSKLDVIASQIRSLQEQAQAILEGARRDLDLHRAICRFKRLPGHVYHLYRRPDDALYFSVLSPDDWKSQPPHPFEGSYRLEADMSWTPAEEIDAHVDPADAVRGLLDAVRDPS